MLPTKDAGLAGAAILCPGVARSTAYSFLESRRSRILPRRYQRNPSAIVPSLDISSLDVLNEGQVMNMLSETQYKRRYNGARMCVLGGTSAWQHINRPLDTGPDRFRAFLLP
jgi:hypothetical protein